MKRSFFPVELLGLNSLSTTFRTMKKKHNKLLRKKGWSKPNLTFQWQQLSGHIAENDRGKKKPVYADKI